MARSILTISDTFEQTSLPKLAPAEEPEQQIAAQIGDVPGCDIGFERRIEHEGDADENRPGDRVDAALPADEIEPVQRAEHADRRRRAHRREQGAVEHRQPEVLLADPEPSAKERQYGDGDNHSADAADDVQCKREAGRSLELLVIAGGERMAAVADDHLPRLELADAARRLGVAYDEDEHAEHEDAESPAGEGKGGDSGDACNDLGRGEIAAVLKQRPEVRVLEPVLHKARLEGREPSANVRSGNQAGSGTRCWMTLSASGPFSSARWSSSAS